MKTEDFLLAEYKKDFGSPKISLGRGSQLPKFMDRGASGLFSGVADITTQYMRGKTEEKVTKIKSDTDQYKTELDAWNARRNKAFDQLVDGGLIGKAVGLYTLLSDKKPTRLNDAETTTTTKVIVEPDPIMARATQMKENTISGISRDFGSQAARWARNNMDRD
jgi:hypothetical protein